MVSFPSCAEAYVHATCILLGVAMLMPLNALTSAPRYMVEYYKYVTDNPEATPSNPTFWANILTFYNVASVVTQILCGPTVLTPLARRLSLRTRFILALTPMMVEVIVTMLLPVGKGVSQRTAIVAFFIVTIAAGAGKSYLEATCYATVGTMPPKFMSVLMFGCGFSGVIASMLQCIVKVALPDTYAGTRIQAYIYFSLALGFMVIALAMALSLQWNSFAQTYVGEYRAARLRRAHGTGTLPCEPCKDIPHTHNMAHVVTASLVLEDGITSKGNNNAVDSISAHEIAAATAAQKEKGLQVDETHANDDGGVRAVGEDESEACADQNMTTSQQLQHTHVWSVVKRIYPVQIACFNIFFLSLLIFPSLIIPVDRVDKWFTTIAILLYNCGDATGRLTSSIRCLWPSRKVLLIVSIARFAFLPLVLLCIYKYIPGHVVPYIIMALVGLSNGFFGATAMVLGPITSTLRTNGERVMAGQLMGIALLAGASIASLLALLIVLYLP